MKGPEVEMTSLEALDERMRRVETDQAIWEERWKSISMRLNIIFTLLVMLLGVAAAGNPIVELVRRISGQ